MHSRVVLITGASAGLGRACADRLALEGHRVFGTSRRAGFAAAPAAPDAPRMIPLDVRDDESVARALACVRAEAGRLDVVVNNAGFGLAGAVEDTSVAEARALFETNLFGVHRVCRAALPILRAQGSGLIINVSSLAGRLTIPFQGFYSASKYALESMSDALRMEVAPLGIRVVLIEPGDFRTRFTDSRVLAAGSGPASPYAARAARAVAAMERDERNGADPVAVARLVARLIGMRSPRARYPIGAPAQTLAARLVRALPVGLVDRVLRRVYGGV